MKLTLTLEVDDQEVDTFLTRYAEKQAAYLLPLILKSFVKPTALRLMRLI